eukprot:1115150-Heterocapsa_arctica.AAC.1
MLRDFKSREPLSRSRTAHGPRGPPGLRPAGGEDTVESLGNEMESLRNEMESLRNEIFNIYFNVPLCDYHHYENLFNYFFDLFSTSRMARGPREPPGSEPAGEGDT